MSAKCVPKPAPHFDPINRHDADRPTDPGAAVLQTDAKNFHEVDGIPQKETLAPGHDVEPLDPAGSTDMSIVRMVTLTIAMLLTFFLATVAVAAVTLLIPSMVRDLGGTQLQMQWINSSYSLSLGCGALFAARFADMFGRRTLYICGLIMFTVFTTITGALRNRLAMCFTRAFAGLGLAIACPAGFGIVGTTIKQEPARTIVFATFGVGAPVGGALGGLLGGAMSAIGSNGWSYLFYLLGGLAGLVVGLGWFAVPRDPDENLVAAKDRRIDWVGGLGITAAICLFTVSLIESGVNVKGWSAPHVPVLFALSISLFVLFYLWSRHLERNTSYPPIIKPSMFTRHRGRISATCASAFFACMSMYMFMFATALFYQDYMGLSAWENAVRILPINIAGTMAAAAVMLLIPRFSTPYLIAAGGLASGIAAVLYAIRPEGTNFWAIEFPAQLLVAWNIDLATTIGNIVVSNLVEQDEQSVGGALFQTSCQIGSALGTALSSLVISQVGDARGELLSGMRAAYWFSCGLAFVVMPVALIRLRGVGLAKDIRGAA